MKICAAGAALWIAMWLTGGLASGEGLDGRECDPVVLEGKVLPSLLHSPPDRIVGFQWQDGWVPIPVQIDERKVVDFGALYDRDPSGITFLTYADVRTGAGADDDPTFDADDELVFMARDSGDRAANAETAPKGTLPGSSLELEITDPLDGHRAYLYLFRSDGSLHPDAGEQYVQYAFKLLTGDGDYRRDYRRRRGPNAEDSTVSSPFYQTHFSDRWIRDEIHLFADGASAVNVLDRHRNLFGPGNCVRSEETFAKGEGAFIINKSGPVRALRAYVGANSGPLTERDHWFYDRREDTVTRLRVHPIPGVMDLFDYSAAAHGMTYFDDLNPEGVEVDGEPDTIKHGPISLELLRGHQGSLIHVMAIRTDIPDFSYGSYYADDRDTGTVQCSGDTSEYATSGLWLKSRIPNTDPRSGAAARLELLRTIDYGGPAVTMADAGLRAKQALEPLQVVARPSPETVRR